MRPHPLVPSPRRTLATLTALLISAALSLGFSPLSNFGLGKDASALTLGGEPCGLAKVSTAGAAVSTASPTASTADLVVSPASPVVSAPKPLEKISTASPAVKVPTDSPPVGVLQSCPGVRPGGILETDEGAQCTYNFLFTDGSHDYIGTAGHCVLPGPQARVGSSPLETVERSWAPPRGPVARDAAGKQVGVFVYGIRSEAHDFALIRLNDGVSSSPQMCHFGGPTGINNDRIDESVTLHYYGNGVVIGTLVPARPAVGSSMSDPNHVFAHGVVAPGDSGAGVISADGRAVGNISEAGFGLNLAEGVVSITRIGPQITAAEKALGMKQGSLKLRTAPLMN